MQSDNTELRTYTYCVINEDQQMAKAGRNPDRSLKKELVQVSSHINSTLFSVISLGALLKL